MTINSRQKGARSERLLAHTLNGYGYETRRGRQFCGLHGDADVVGLDGIHIECKNVQKLNVWNAMAQSDRDARDGEIPVVMHKKDRTGWLVTMHLEDWMELYGAWQRRQQKAT